MGIDEMIGFLDDSIDYQYPTKYSVIRVGKEKKYFKNLHNLVARIDLNIVYINDMDDILSGYDMCCFLISDLTRKIRFFENTIVIESDYWSVIIEKNE